MSYANQPIEYYQVDANSRTQISAEIIIEAPVSLTVNGETWLTFMCTPIQLEALAVGFLYNEDLIQSMDEVADLRLCPSGDNVDVWLTHPLEKPERWLRTSGCTGGVTSIQSENQSQNEQDRIWQPDRCQDSVKFTHLQVGNLVEALLDAQNLYRKSGGVHTSVLSDGQQIYAVGEDIGRHNTLDKIAGLCLIQHIEPACWVLLTTGRVSSEMLQKASRLGASFVISRTSPTSLSIQLAERWGITLIGYARRSHFRIYTHPERIIDHELKK
jgi:FdhD protein